MISKQFYLSIGALLCINSVLAESHEIASKKLQSTVLTLPNGTYLQYQASTINGKLVAENDILIGPDRTNESLLQTKGSGTSYSTGKWFNGIIPYQYADNITDLGLIDRSIEAINHWNDRSTIKLVERNPSNASIYKDYLEISLDTGCRSYVGRNRGKQEILFSNSCSTGSMIHEFGHAIGLLHEHTRIDRDQYINVNFSSIVDGREHNFAIPASNSSRDLGAYDYGSIMHYGAYFFSSNGNPTLSPINDITGIDLGQRVALSEGDLKAVAKLYQTDLSLSVIGPESIPPNSSVEVKFMVTNQGEQGANSILITIPLNSSNQLTSYIGEGWVCEQQAERVVCGIATLIEGSHSSLAVTLKTGFEPPSQILANLSSKTWDSDLTNNGLELAGGTQLLTTGFLAEPQLGSARADIDSGSGAGSIPLLQILGLIALLLHRKLKFPSAL